MFQVKPGDKVAYSAAWLRSAGFFTGDVPRMRGIVLMLKHLNGECPPVVYIRWNDNTIGKVIEPNLAIVGANTRFCAC
jgi:hypothetical protein